MHIAFCTVPGQHCDMTPKSVMSQCARDMRIRSVSDSQYVLLIFAMLGLAMNAAARSIAG